MSQNYKFVTKSLEDEIRGIIIPSIFPKLNGIHRELLIKYTIRFINIIALIFNFDDDTYMFQLKQNNYQDIKWLIAHLLPFLNNKDNRLHNLTSFNEIYVNKKKDVDVNITEPVYTYSNIQYNRFERNEDNYIERQFDEKDLEHNFFILLDSLKTMSNKLHVNWMDILPITLNDFENEKLFKDTKNNLDNGTFLDWDPVEEASFVIEEEKMCKNLNNKIKGLDLYDIYNTLSYDLYEEIKQIKWLIYDIPTSKNIYPVIIILSLFFNISSNLNQIEWDNIDNSKFTNMWNNFVRTAELGNNIVYQTFNISSESLRKLMKGILFSFDKAHWSKTRKISEEIGYIPIPQDAIKRLLENEDFEDDEEDDIQFSAMLPSLKSFDAKLMYDFMTECLQKFKGTWYGTKLLNETKTNIKERRFLHFVATDKKIPITYKNIYNFSKSMVHHVVLTNAQDGKTISKFVRYPENWKSLNKQQKDDIIARLNNKYQHWFSILRYIKNLYGHVTLKIETHDPIEINRDIYDKLMEELCNIIFEAMICKGVLTKFVPDSRKTNLSNISRDKVYLLQNELFDTSDKNKYWTDAYHYLTGTPYKHMKEFTVNEKGQSKKYNYFTFGKTPDGGQWYSIYAYDWVAQIGFCHHFLNNRVIFITGATGVGKSTEVPKLFLYFSKSLEYITNPHLVCTEPRTGPTKKNAGWVATCLGVPLNGFENGQKTKTNNYYIQMQFRENGSHFKDVKHASLKYITDGTLILEANNPVQKQKFIKRVKDKENLPVEESFSFTKSNMYDVIMVDEAHEHKINMDLLLTLLKFGNTYNNRTKLVILSATMDNDEPKYRRYFRDINDNKKYPLCTWLRDNKLDRINVDRRYHISPPNMGTRYKVTEFYTPGVTEFDAVMNIVSKSDSGHILVFEPGTKEILQLVNKLNSHLPADMVAIPYHSKIADDKKSFIDDINNNLKLYKIDRSVNLSDPSISMNTIHLGNNTYTRAVIVATNIAEASITIVNLKYVVDTGTQKLEPYDYKKRGNVKKTIFIAEENRIQRKGRVGRKGPGDVYYLYKKGALEDNTIDYEISTSNISVNMFSKLKNKEIEKELITKNMDPNKPTTKLEFNKIKEMYGEFGLDSLILEQYFLGEQYYDYYGNDNMYDYKNYKNLHPFYESGLDANSLTDNRGTFYLIHPNELDIERNIMGDITGKKNGNKEITFKKDRKYAGYIVSKKIRSFWQMLLDYLYIGFNENNDTIIKTTLGIEMITLFEILQLDPIYYGLIRSLIFGIAVGCGEDMMKLTAFYMAAKMSPLNLNKNRVFSHDPYIGSDSKIILRYLNEFDTLLEKNGLNTNLISNAIKLYSKISEVKQYNLTRNDVRLLLGPEDRHTPELIRAISSEEKKAKVIESIENAIIEELFKNIEANTESIQIWCNTNNLNFATFMEYIKEYCKLRSSLSRKMIKQREEFIVTLKNNFAKLSIFEERQLDLVDISLLFGFPFNVCKKVDDTIYYLSLYNPNMDNVYKIKSTSDYKYKPNTLVNLAQLQNYVLYFTIEINPETDDDTMACLHKVDPSLITILAHIYNKRTFTKITSNTNLMKSIGEIIDKREPDKSTDLGRMILNYTKTLEQIETDLSEYSRKQSMSVIINIDKRNERIFE